MFVYPEIPQKIIDTIRSCSLAVIVGHVGPDGDCIHSQIAMQELLLKLGIEVHLVNAGPFSRKENQALRTTFRSNMWTNSCAHETLWWSWWIVRQSTVSAISPMR